MNDLYLDLIQKCLLNTIYEDPAADPWSPHVFSAELRDKGRDWPSQAHTMIGNQRLTNLRCLVENVLQENVAGDFIETGVWRGGACIFMRAILKAWNVVDRNVWVADSFEGLPVPSHVEDAGDPHHTYKQLAISLELVQSNFRKYDLLDGQVRFLKGWFKDTLSTAAIEKLAILRLDGDMYESTMDALNALYKKVSSQGYVIVDDYGAVAACKRAVHDFRATEHIEEPLVDIDGLGVFWQKSE